MPININTNLLEEKYEERIRWMMGVKQFGRRCRFLYPPMISSCPNCFQGAGGLSLGQYKPGGTVPFADTVCPVCLGKGTFEESKTEEDILIVLFDSKQWFSPGGTANLPDNSAMIIGDRQRTWNKVLQSYRIILNTDAYTDQTQYRLSGEMYPVGLFNGDSTGGSKFFYAYLVREKAG